MIVNMVMNEGEKKEDMNAKPSNIVQKVRKNSKSKQSSKTP